MARRSKSNSKNNAPEAVSRLAKDDARAIRKQLLSWYDRAKRDLPWRRTRDPYAIWLSEVMLQQTQVTTVIPYWERFLARYPRMADLAAAPLADVLALWRGLGYYSRARSLHRAAQDVVARFDGKLPADLEALRTLPSFGPYTAGAVASIAFGLEAPLVDGNVARVLSRVCEVEGVPQDRAREAQLWALATELVQGERPGDFNQALMELGATVCRPEAPLCLVCPLQSHCLALKHGRVDELPPKKVRAARKALLLSAGVLARDGKLLLGRRREDGLFGGLWELPCVEESQPLDASRRATALSRELGLEASALNVGASPLGKVQRTLTHRDLTLTLYALELREVPRVSETYLEYAWVHPSAVRERGMSTAMQHAFDGAVNALENLGQTLSDVSKPTKRHRAATPRARRNQ